MPTGDSSENSRLTTKPHVDVLFPLLLGKDPLFAPIDHGHSLYGALSSSLPSLHGAEWLAVHSLEGRPDAAGILSIDHGSRLRLRVQNTEVHQLFPLAGAVINLLGREISLGQLHIEQLRPALSLYSRIVVIKGFTEHECFKDAVQRALERNALSGSVTIGRRRVVRIHDHTAVGFEVRIDDLRPECSLHLQYLGIGGRRRMGCGIFTPPDHGP